jgi:superfamily II DNA or RNA helicase
MKYSEFLKKKIKHVHANGFKAKELNKNLFPFQKHMVEVALWHGRFAILADCGLGKTIMQLAWADAISKNTKGKVLVLAPLAVVAQTIEEGATFGIQVCEYGDPNDCQIHITNYENLAKIENIGEYKGVVIDESSILKNFDGEYKKLIIESFSKTPYKLACTATPSPNDDMEICNHAEFLGHGTRSEILATYFTHDGGETAKWRLKGHAVDRFWEFVSKWSLMVSNPSDLGFDGSKYVLPKINYIREEIMTPTRDNSGLFNSVSVSATEFNGELKLTREARIKRVAEIVNENPGENFIVWVNHNEEGQLLRSLIPDAVEVTGNDEKDFKKSRLLGFAKNEFRVLITKAKIAQFGLNYQNCRNQVFACPDFSFESLYQRVRRSYRFGQKQEVNIYLITTDTMQNVVAAINRKEEQFINMKNKMAKYATRTV